MSDCGGESCADRRLLRIATGVVTLRVSTHLHEGHETAIYIADGEVEVWHGPGLATLSMSVRDGFPVAAHG